MSWGSRYLDHYGRFLGEPRARRVFASHGAHRSLQIFEYDGVFAGCSVYASLGLSHFHREVGGILEVLMPIEGDLPVVPPLLANALSVAVRDELPLARGSVIAGVANIDPAFSAQFAKHAIYFTTPWDLPEAARFVEAGGVSGRVLLAFFLSQAEGELLRDQGAEALEIILEVGGVDPYRLSRPSVV